jgi:hypothetical protein
MNTEQTRGLSLPAKKRLTLSIESLKSIYDGPKMSDTGDPVSCSFSLCSYPSHCDCGSYPSSGTSGTGCSGCCCV